MGQYYKPINIDKKEWIYSHHFENGMKLMEHSYLENDFVGAVEILLTPLGPWHKCHLVWAGDYADVEKKEGKNLFEIVDEENKIEPITPHEIQTLKDKKQIVGSDYRYIVNHTKKQYVDKNKIKSIDESGWKIHPLPLLTSEGNGGGGGDYHSEVEADKVGIWARDSISIEKKIPKGYEEIVVPFKE